MVPEHRHHAERGLQVAERAYVRRNVGRRDVDHVSRLDDQVGAERVGLGHDLLHLVLPEVDAGVQIGEVQQRDRKSTRLNSSHRTISYAVFCLKKKKKMYTI